MSLVVGAPLPFDDSAPFRDSVMVFLIDIRFSFAYTVLVMPRREITPAQAFGIIAERIEKRIQTLQNMRLDGYKYGDFGNGFGVATGAEGAAVFRFDVHGDHGAEAVMRPILAP